MKFHLFICIIFLLAGSFSISAAPLTYVVVPDTSPSSIGSNAYILHDSSKAIVVDTGNSAGSTHQVTDDILAYLSAHALPLQLIFLTHGHPDHFSGVPALIQAFPACPVAVATAAVRNELLYLVNLLNASSLLDPASASFDWFAAVQVLAGPSIDVFLPDHPALVVDADFLASESLALSAVWDPQGLTLLSGDLLYHKVHCYLGTPVDPLLLQNWMLDNMARLQGRYGADVVLSLIHI